MFNNGTFLPVDKIKQKKKKHKQQLRCDHGKLYCKCLNHKNKQKHDANKLVKKIILFTSLRLN